MEQLAAWDRANGLLGQELTEAALGLALPEWAAGVGRMEDVRRRQARQALLEAIARHHHHGGPRRERPGRRPW
ncbi:hypothetical protein OHV05_34995 [Kitasatospora sp. NBC_00070]|uniref:hypothetical protein n=1 Tax=Kitasatospora sp. NBC_00070 TaxID=2975962 RepID=UPI003255938D